MAQETLLRDLRMTTQLVLSGIGEDPKGVWIKEPSWLVLGLDLDTAKELGRRYQQKPYCGRTPMRCPG